MTESQYEDTFNEYLENAAKIHGDDFSNLVYLYFSLLSYQLYMESSVGTGGTVHTTIKFLHALQHFDDVMFCVGQKFSDLPAELQTEAYKLAICMRDSLTKKYEEFK